MEGLCGATAESEIREWQTISGSWMCWRGRDSEVGPGILIEQIETVSVILGHVCLRLAVCSARALIKHISIRMKALVAGR